MWLLALLFSLLLSLDASAFSPVLMSGSRPLQVVASGGVIPFNQVQSAGGNFACKDTIIYYQTGSCPVSEMRLAVPGWMIAPSTVASESNVITNFPVAASLIWPTSITVPFSWGQVPSLTVISGTVFALSDPIYPGQANASTFSGGFRVVTRERAPNGSYYLIGRQISASLIEQSFYNSCAQNNLAITTPSLTTDATYSAAGYGPAMAMIVGRYTKPCPSALIDGDSIPDGTGDVAGWGATGYGYIARGLNSAGIAWSKQTAASRTVSSDIVNGYPKRQAMWRFYSVAYKSLSENDILSIATSVPGYSLATLQTGLQQEWSAQAASGLQVIHETPVVYTDSLDNWATQLNQTSYEIYNQPRNTMENFIISATGTWGLASTLKMRSTWAVSPAGNNWATSGVTANYSASDQVHPSSLAGGHPSGSVVISTSTVGVRFK